MNKEDYDKGTTILNEIHLLELGLTQLKWKDATGICVERDQTRELRFYLSKEETDIAVEAIVKAFEREIAKLKQMFREI